MLIAMSSIKITMRQGSGGHGCDYKVVAGAEDQHAKKDDGSDVRVCDSDEVSITGEDSKFMKVTPTIIPGSKRQHVYIF